MAEEDTIQRLKNASAKCADGSQIDVEKGSAAMQDEPKEHTSESDPKPAKEEGEKNNNINSMISILIKSTIYIYKMIWSSLIFFA